MGKYSGQNGTAVAIRNQTWIKLSRFHDKYTATATPIPTTR